MTGVSWCHAFQAATPLRRHSTCCARGTLTGFAFAAELKACAVHQQVHGLAGGLSIGAGPPRPRHLQRRRMPAQRGVVRHAQAEAKQANDGAEQPLGLPVYQAEHRTDRERRQDGQRRIPRLPTPGRAWFGRPRYDRTVGKPHRQTAALTQAGVISRPVRHLVPLARNVVTAVLVQLERHDGHPAFGRATPYVTQRLSTTARSVHHAYLWRRVVRHGT